MNKCKEHKHCDLIGIVAVWLLIFCACHYLGFWRVVLVGGLTLFAVDFLHTTLRGK